VSRRTGLGAVVKRNFHPLSGVEPPIIRPVAQRFTTELSRLLLVWVGFTKPPIENTVTQIGLYRQRIYSSGRNVVSLRVKVQQCGLK
jgi:hypothetical protein